MLGADPAFALLLTDQHLREHARGLLIQEREALAIEALVRLGRRQAAARRADTCIARYPRSSYRPRVERAVGM